MGRRQVIVGEGGRKHALKSKSFILLIQTRITSLKYPLSR